LHETNQRQQLAESNRQMNPAAIPTRVDADLDEIPNHRITPSHRIPSNPELTGK